MLKTLIKKEMRLYFTSPGFVAVFGTFSVLMLLSIFIGIQEYGAAMKQYETGYQPAQQRLTESRSWAGAEFNVFRRPDPMQIFVSGVSNDIGRFSKISKWSQVKLEHSPYSDDPIYATFRFLDFNFIVQVVLSLLAIMFTFNSVCGERESGTLKLTFANAVPRARFLLAKIIGSWLGLTIAFLVPFLLSLLLLFVYKIPFDANHWQKLVLLLFNALLYFTTFILLGILVSALTRTSAVSFITLLVVWVALVLIIPRTSVMFAANIVPVPGIEEIDSQLEVFSTGRWKIHEKQLSGNWEKRNTEMSGMSAEEREAYREKHMWKWMEEDEESRKSIQTDISEYARKLKEDLRNRKSAQTRLTFNLSRISPASAFSLAAMHLAGSGIEMKDTYERAMEDYHKVYSEFVERKQKESGQPGGIRIEFDSESGFSFSTADMEKTLDVSEMPRFQQPRLHAARILSAVITDFAILLLESLIIFAGAWLAFLKYDLR